MSSKHPRSDGDGDPQPKRENKSYPSLFLPRSSSLPQRKKRDDVSRDRPGPARPVEPREEEFDPTARFPSNPRLAEPTGNVAVRAPLQFKFNPPVDKGKLGPNEEGFRFLYRYVNPYELDQNITITDNKIYYQDYPHIGKFYFMKATYRLNCIDSRHRFSVHDYLLTGAVHDTNFKGFLLFDSSRESHDPSYFNKADQFRRRGGEVPAHRMMFLTDVYFPPDQHRREKSIDPSEEESYSRREGAPYVVGNQNYDYIHCPETGRAKHETLEPDGKGGYTTNFKSHAGCRYFDHLDKCPRQTPLLTKLGILMPIQNLVEYNLIGTSSGTDINGYLIYYADDYYEHDEGGGLTGRIYRGAYVDVYDFSIYKLLTIYENNVPLLHHDINNQWNRIVLEGERFRNLRKLSHTQFRNIKNLETSGGIKLELKGKVGTNPNPEYTKSGEFDVVNDRLLPS